MNNIKSFRMSKYHLELKEMVQDAVKAGTDLDIIYNALVAELLDVNDLEEKKVLHEQA